MKRKLIKALVVLILLGAGGIAYQFYQTKQQSDALAFEAVDMNRLQDGSYEGECQTGLVQVRLRLRIQNAAIQRIELLQHDNGMGMLSVFLKIFKSKTVRLSMMFPLPPYPAEQFAWRHRMH